MSACCIERAVWSQPPPGAAGAMIFSSIWAKAWLENELANRAALTINAPRQTLRTDKDMHTLLELPEAI